MTALCVYGRNSPNHFASLLPLLASLLTWLAAAFLLFALASPLMAAERIVVFLDHARVIKLPDRASTVVVGDPLIADLSIEPGGIAVVTGKGYGATNFIVMDRSGTVLMEKNVEVTGSTDRTVVVYRGANQETYSCTPLCERQVTLGDFPDFFDKTLAQIVARNAQAAGAAAH
ncbi:MAG TPA: pilus assembly protein N-terminal domain-containing protein [Xanthobacteraceae bacterium]|nr:pilus assembly protein N-terminal domain-containing protein [Xanthobacteraceae bacterium]